MRVFVSLPLEYQLQWSHHATGHGNEDLMESMEIVKIVEDVEDVDMEQI